MSSFTPPKRGQRHAAGFTTSETCREVMMRETVNLRKIHTLIDWRMHLKTLRVWKEKGRIYTLALPGINSENDGLDFI